MITVEFVPIFIKWLEKQNKEAHKVIMRAIDRIRQGNTSSLKGLRGGISEIKIHYGAGIRVYIVQKGDVFYVVLWGGTDKKTQAADIEKAINIKQFWEANENEKKQ
jgi:putative addiction module killer protein